MLDHGGIPKVRFASRVAVARSRVRIATRWLRRHLIGRELRPRISSINRVASIAIAVFMSACSGEPPLPPQYDTAISCSFELSGRGSVSRFTQEDGTWIMSADPVSNLVCEDREIDLESTTIVGGFITTKIFGKIQIESESSSGSRLTFLMPLEQVQKLRSADR